MKRFFFFISFFIQFSLFSQTNFSAKFLGLTIHPFGDPTAHLQPYKFDKNAVFVMNFGGVLSFEKYIIGDVLSLKGVQALGLDCSAGMLGVSHIGVKGTFLRKERHRMGLSIGPAFMVRESWHRFEDYESSGFLKNYDSKIFGDLQYNFFFVAAEIEYDYSISDKLDFSASFTPGLPMAITFAVGCKYWLNKDFKHKLYLPKVK